MTFTKTAGAAAISGFSPASGQPGNVVTITGTGLSAATLVQFNANQPADADFIILSDSEIQTVVPIGATTGPFGITVNNATIASAASFAVAPSISTFLPGSGAAGTPVVISGANFIPGATQVKFAGAPAVAGTVTASSQVTAIVPNGATNGPITVSTSAGAAISTNAFSVSTAPIVTDFSPTIGTNLSTVIIDGANFVSDGTVVKFNGTASLTVNVTSSTQLHAVVPSGAKTGPISVSVGAAAFTTSSNFTTASGLVVTGFGPAYGSPDQTVNLAGVGLNAATAVIFSNNVNASITGKSDTQLQVVIPAGAKTGPLTVSSAAGSFHTTSNFTVLSGPLVTGFSPSIGQAGAAVTINGLNFSGATAVKFNGVNAASFSVTAETQISAHAPAGGTGPVSVFVGSASSTTSSNFTVTTAAPYISGFTPASAVRGQAVTINGANFVNLPAAAVRIGGATATFAPVTATTELTAYVPAAAVSGLITVSNGSGGDASAGPLYLQPWITNFAPVKGWVYSNLTVTGRNFANATALSVNGVKYNLSATASTIVAPVPSNASPGLLTIATPGGLVISTNSFAILPKIFGFSPVIGPRNTLVTITGTSLQNVTDVQFGGREATPLKTSFGEITVEVPTNGLTGPIEVFEPVGTDTTTSNFLVTQSTQTTLTKTANRQIAAPGENVAYSLYLTNFGSSIMTGVVVTDALPAGLSFVSASVSVGSITVTNSVVYWNMPPLTNQTAASATIIAAATVNALLTNTAGVNFAEAFLSGGFFTASSPVYFANGPSRTLQALQTNGQFVVSWPATGLNFVLQTNDNLGRYDNWSNLEAAPVVIGGTNYVTNAIGAPAQFFRLKTPGQ